MTIIATAYAQKTNEVGYAPASTWFRVSAAPEVKSATLRLYRKAADAKPYKTVKMKPRTIDGWQYLYAEVKGNLSGVFYTFDTGNGECPGVFAQAVSVNGKKAQVIDMKTTDPEGWRYDRQVSTASPADLVIYEMHHRDFSIDPSSGVRPEYRGKFLALTEPTSIAHLKALGVNAVHILPSFDYASVDESQPERAQYNWGYDPLNYNVPEGSYSTDATTPAVRIREFKEMVQALHRAGIRVILDVVYNHTFNTEGSNFQKIYPDAYFRKTADGQYSNGSGCGNETASERPLMREYMIESVLYWAKEYHIDGFRFDLMGIHDIETMNQIRKAVSAYNPEIFIYGEGWSAGACAIPNEVLGMKANIPQMPGIAAFSDDMRDALRGPFSDDTKGAFLAGIAGEEESLKAGIAGMVAHPQVDYTKVNYSQKPYALQPTQMISYVSCHDDMCLVDRLKASIPGIQTDEIIRLDLLAQTAVMLSQGVPFMLSGEEMLRDKKGVHNSFESPDEINHLDWGNMKRYPQVLEYYQRLIALRHHHPAFRLGTADKVRQYLKFLPSQDCLVAFCLTDYAGGDSWRNIIVALNGSKETRTIEVPEDRYTVVCADGHIDENGLGTVEGSKIEVKPQTAIILHN